MGEIIRTQQRIGYIPQHRSGIHHRVQRVRQYPAYFRIIPHGDRALQPDELLRAPVHARHSIRDLFHPSLQVIANSRVLGPHASAQYGLRRNGVLTGPAVEAAEGQNSGGTGGNLPLKKFLKGGDDVSSDRDRVDPFMRFRPVTALPFDLQAEFILKTGHIAGDHTDLS